MFQMIWTALGDLRPGQAVVLTGFVGFLTLASGHVLNAWLTRRRDARLDSLQRKRAVQAFAAELTVVQTQLELARDASKDGAKDRTSWTVIPKCSAYTPFRADLIKNLSLLNDKQILLAANIYGQFDYFDAMIKRFGDNDNPVESNDIGSSIELNLSSYGIVRARKLLNVTITAAIECREIFLKSDLLHSDRETELKNIGIQAMLTEVIERQRKGP